MQQILSILLFSELFLFSALIFTAEAADDFDPKALLQLSLEELSTIEIEETIPESNHSPDIISDTMPGLGLELDMGKDGLWRAETVAVRNSGDNGLNGGLGTSGESSDYLFNKASQGYIHEHGLEAVLHYSRNVFNIYLGHTQVQTENTDSLHQGGLYTSPSQSLQAYPENITRTDLVWNFHPKWRAAGNYLVYWNRHTPDGQKVGGNHLLNFNVSYQPSDMTELSLSAKNVLGDDELNPANQSSNFQAPGDSLLEERSFWLSGRIRF